KNHEESMRPVLARWARQGARRVAGWTGAGKAGARPGHLPARIEISVATRLGGGIDPLAALPTISLSCPQGSGWTLAARRTEESHDRLSRPFRPQQGAVLDYAGPRLRLRDPRAPAGPRQDRLLHRGAPRDVPPDGRGRDGQDHHLAADHQPLALRAGSVRRR